MPDPHRLTVVLALLLGCAAGGRATVAGISSCSGRRSLVSGAPLRPHTGYNPASMVPRLRGGSNFELDDQCVVDPTHVAGVGIGFKKDKVGNHLVVSLAKGWPAALSGQVMEGDILLEIDEAPVAPLSTTALVQALRGTEGTQVNLLLQRGEQGELVNVCLERVLQGVVDPNEPPKRGFSLESAIDLGFSFGNKASSLIPSLPFGSAKASAAAVGDQGSAALGDEAGVGIGFSCDEEANFIISKIVPGSPAALSRQVKAGDILVLVDGMPLDDLSVKDLSKLLKGPVGTSVQLHLKRRGSVLQVTLTRNHPGVGGGGKSAGGSSVAAEIFNSVSGIASSSLSSLSGAAGGASAALASMSSLMPSLSSLSRTSSKPVNPADLVYMYVCVCVCVCVCVVQVFYFRIIVYCVCV